MNKKCAVIRRLRFIQDDIHTHIHKHTSIHQVHRNNYKFSRKTPDTLLVKISSIKRNCSCDGFATQSHTSHPKSFHLDR